MELNERLATLEAREKSNSHRLDEVELRQRDIEKLVTGVELIAQKQSVMETDVQEMKSDIRHLTDLPGSRWELVIEKIISTVVGAVLLFLLAKYGL